MMVLIANAYHRVLDLVRFANSVVLVTANANQSLSIPCVRFAMVVNNVDCGKANGCAEVGSNSLVYYWHLFVV